MVKPESQQLRDAQYNLDVGSILMVDQQTDIGFYTS